jgi:hypothetical protein
MNIFRLCLLLTLLLLLLLSSYDYAQLQKALPIAGLEEFSLRNSSGRKGCVSDGLELKKVETTHFMPTGSIRAVECYVALPLF